MSTSPRPAETPSGSSPPGPPDQPLVPPRRSFLKEAAAVVIGGVIGLVPLVYGLLFFLDPVARKRQPPSLTKSRRDGDGFLYVTLLEEVPASGAPQKFTVVADRVDAWTYYQEQRIGNVILRRVSREELSRMTEEERQRVSPVEGQSGLAGLMAFTDVCPHLGCTVDFKPLNPDSRAFFCPCHSSAFSLTGGKTNAIPPRHLDALAAKVVTGTGDEKQVWVNYERFKAGVSEKIPTA